MTMIAALVLLSTALPALIAGLVLLNTGLIQWLDGENDIPFGLPEWVRLGILIPALAVLNITVDNQSVFISSDSIPGTAFLPDSAQTEFGMTCGVGQTIKITVENQEHVGGAPSRVFTAHLEGLTVR